MLKREKKEKKEKQKVVKLKRNKEGIGLTFDSKSHTYRDYSGDIYTSGTTFVSLFKQPFNKDFWSFYKACQYSLGFTDEQKKEFSRPITKSGFDWSKANTIDDLVLTLNKVFTLPEGLNSWYDVDTQKVLDDWAEKTKQALTKGTKFHNTKEYEDLQTYKLVTDWEFIDVKKGNLVPLVYPEMRLYCHKNKLAGTADWVKVNKDFTVDISDYKTSKHLDYDGFARMKEPVSHLPDVNYIHYTLQMSLYAWFLEQQGYKIGDMKIIWARQKEDYKGDLIWTEEDIPVMYLKREIESMIKYYSDNKLGKK
jgi:hypothetical protein